MKSAGSGTRTLTAVTGDCATSVRQEGNLVAVKVAALRAEVESVCTSDVLLHQVCDIFYIVTDTLLHVCCIRRYFAVTSVTVIFTHFFPLFWYEQTVV
jgi:hypothetical protein